MYRTATSTTLSTTAPTGGDVNWMPLATIMARTSTVQGPRPSGTWAPPRDPVLRQADDLGIGLAVHLPAHLGELGGGGHSQDRVA